MNTLIQEILTPAREPKLLFTSDNPPFNDLRHKNVEVMRVYTNIVKDFRYILSRMNYNEHRTYLLTSYESNSKYADNVLFDFVCVMCSLTLSVKKYAYYITLEADSEIAKVIGVHNYLKVLRAVYRATMQENTEHYLEECVDIQTCLNDHYSYFKNRIKLAGEENSMVVIEDAVIE